MAAGDTELTCPLDLRREGFHLLYTVGMPIHWHGIEDAVVIAEGDLLMSSLGLGAILATANNVKTDNFLGIAAAPAGSATASANDDTLVPCYLPGPNDLMWAYVATGTLLVTDVGVDFDFTDETGINQDDVTIPTLGISFLCLGTDLTNNMALGVLRSVV